MNHFTKFHSLLFFALIGLIGFSCNSEDDSPAEADTSIVVEVSQVNQKFEDLDNLTLAVLESTGLGARKSNTTAGDFCASTEVTTNSEQKLITVDFGAGCESPNGVTRKGKFTIAYSGNLLVPGANIVTTFDGYEVNGYKIEGTRTITNTKLDIFTSTITLAVKIENGKVTFPDGKFVTINTDEIREITLGSAGYEAKLTGTASGRSLEGNDYTATVTESLIISQSCLESGIYSPSSGQIQFTYKGASMTLDYGSGECDKAGTITYPGGTKDITFD